MIRKVLLLIACGLLMVASARATYVDIHHFGEREGLMQCLVTDVMQDRTGYIWLSSWDGLSRYDGYRFVNYKAQPGDGCPLRSNRILFIREMADGNILCKCHDGFYVFRRDNLTFASLTGKKTDSGDRYRATDADKQKIGSLSQYRQMEFRILYKDRQGGYWVYTHRGLERVTFAPSKPTPHQYGNHAKEEFVRCLYVDRKGRQFVADKNGYLMIVDGQNVKGYVGRDGSVTQQPQRLGINVYAMLEDSHGYLWLGTKPGGLARLQPKAQGGYRACWLTSFHKNLQNEQGVYSLVEDGRGHILVGDFGSGLNIVTNPWTPREEDLNVLNRNNGLAGYPSDADKVRCMLLLRNGTLLMGTDNGLFSCSVAKGLKGMRFFANKRNPTDPHSLGNNQVINILQTRNGRIYLATYGGGLNLLTSPVDQLLTDKVRFEILTTANGMCDDVVLNMMEDHRGDIWMASERSLMQYNPKRGLFSNYMEDSFGSSFSFSEASPVLSRDGRHLSFATTQGVLSIGIDQLGKSKFVPRIVFDVAHKVELQPEEKSLSLTMSALDLNRTTPIQYAYILEGVDHDWLYTTDNHINLSNLPAGTHRLRVRSTNGDGVWVNNEASVMITREPYFNERPVAWMLYGALCVALVILIYKVYRYIRRLEQEVSSLKLSAEEKVEYLKVRLGEMMDKETAPDSKGEADSCDVSEFVHRVETFMKEHIADADLDVSQFAQDMGMSRSVFYVQMKKAFGCTPNAYVQKNRIDHACRLLKEGRGQNISEVAYSSGFSDPKYFSRCFKKLMGCTPSEYVGG